LSIRGYGALMSQNTPPGIGDLFGLFGGANPFGAVTKSIAQFQRGVSDFLGAVENFNKTMEQLHSVAVRVNSLLDTVEEPIRDFVPHVARTVRTADAMIEQLAGPIERVAPGLSKLADVLAAPALASLPTDLTEFMTVLSDLAHRLQPLGQIAESAGSLFGLRALTGLRPSVPEPRAAAIPATATVAEPQTPPKKAPARKSPAKKAAAKKAAAKKAPAKKAAAKKSPAKKAPAKKR
jgi:ABC-type transporter Mla subunit MlaD